MKKLKKILIILIIIFAGLYLAFLGLVYAFGDLNKYMPQLQKTVREMSGLEISAQNIRILPTYKVEINLIADDFKLSYPDGGQIAFVDNASMKVPILPIIFGNIKLSEIKIDKPSANFSINKKGEIDIVSYLEPYLEKMQSENENENEKAENSDNEPAQKNGQLQKQNNGLPKYFKISTKMPDIKISNYGINLYDETIKQTVSLKGEELNLLNFDTEKGLKVVTKGQLLSEKQKFLDYNLSVDTFLPKTIEETKKQKVETAYIDPFKSMIDYGFYSDIFADLKISEHKTDGINIKGDLNIKSLNLKTGNTDTKGTFANLKFNKNSINILSDLFLTKNQKANITANISYGKKNNIEADVKSDKLDLIHFLNITKAILNTLGIDNDLSQLYVKGYISPNFSIKSDMKKLESKGHIYLKEGQISHKAFPANISNITSDIDLKNNRITITNTKALVNSQPVEVSGTVKQNADCDLKIYSKNLSLPGLFEIFADKSLKNTYKLSSGNLDFDVKIKGKLDKIMPEITATLNNLSLTDKINHYSATVPAINLTVTTDLKTYKGALNLNSAKIYLQDLKLTALAKNLKLNFDEKDMTLNPFDIDIQNSIFKTEGKIKNYAANMTYEISTKGNMATTTVKSFIPKEFHSMITNKGALPIIATISGDASVIGINANVGANSANYITPVHITQLQGKPSSLKVDIKTKGNDLIINNISLDTQTAHFADVKGQILSYTGKNPIFKNLKINTPTNFSFSIPGFANSIVELTSDLTVGGTMNAPKILGNINVSKLSVPTYKLNVKNLIVNMTNSAIKASSNDVNMAGSDIQFNMSAINNLMAKIFTINNLTVNSNNFDLGKILTVLSELPQNSNAPGTDFPLLIKSGHGNIKNFKLDAIAAQNAEADFNMKDNTLSLNNLKANAYGGNIEGDLSYNLQYLRLKTKMKGQNLNANNVVTTFAGLKDQITGNLNFNADITMAGAEYKQQMQTLKGTTSFVILDGQMGSLGKFEHFLYAQNLLSQSFVKTTIGSVVSKLAPKNTGKFTKMSGDIGLTNGWAQIVKLTSEGPNMSLYLTGKYNLLNNYANIDVLGTISQDVVNSLGAVGDLSLEKLVSNFSKFGNTLSKIVSGYNISTSKENLNKIPKLSTGETAGTKSFKVKIDGNIESASAVKSFMWLMNEAEAEAKKKELIENSTILKNMPNLKQKILESGNSGNSNAGSSQNSSSTSSTTATGNNSETTTQTSVPTEKTTPQNIIPKTKEEFKNNLKEGLKNQIYEKTKQTLPDFLNDVGTKEE